MTTFIENTNDHGYKKECYASNNAAAYILTSARPHDMVSDYQEKYNRWPSSKWYNKYFSFDRIK